jgi:ferrous iron transport protein A
MNSLAMARESSAAVASVSSVAEASVTSAGPMRLSTLPVGSVATVLGVGTPGEPLGALERRLLELGFVSGERVEIVAEARPGRDPFVVRVGSLALALRRREAHGIWVGASTEP